MPPEALNPARSMSVVAGAAGSTSGVGRIAAVIAGRSQPQHDSQEPTACPLQVEAGSDKTNRNIGAVTEKSDIFAFGICLYLWVTKGLQSSLPKNSRGEIDMVTLKKNIPLKWNKWLHSLFDMCLQMKPENRATSKDIHIFLSSRFGK